MKTNWITSVKYCWLLGKKCWKQTKNIEFKKYTKITTGIDKIKHKSVKLNC